MSMPIDLVFVRHGESESNVVHVAERAETIHSAHTKVYERPDWLQRLSGQGVEQAKSAGGWLDSNDMSALKFDRCYASPFMRARETALFVGGQDSAWLLDDRIKERDWGEYGATPVEIRKELFPYSHKNHKTNKWYARMNGGESLADNVLMRARDFIGTLQRDMSSKRVLVVSHGEFMLTMRYLIERMLPEEWLAMDEDAAQEIKNCTIIHYTRQNPDNPKDIRTHVSWVRIVYPYNEAGSPWGGGWREVSEKRAVSGEDLEKQINCSEPLIDREE